MIRALLGSGRARVVPATLALFFLTLGVWYFGGGLYIAAKAEVAQILLERAWEETLKTGQDEKPWSWADTWPVAKIIFPGLNEEAIVLDKTSGQALAFGPGLMPGLAQIGRPGTAIIAAHNDTHFSYLGDLRPGDVFQVETRTGEILSFEILGSETVDIRKPLRLEKAGDPYLVLSTCYPFKSLLSRTPYRYLVTARLKTN